MALTREEALKALAYIVGQMQKNEWMYKDIPECKIRTVKNQKSRIAKRDERGEDDKEGSQKRT